MISDPTSDVMDRVLQKHAQVHGSRGVIRCQLGPFMRGIPCDDRGEKVLVSVASAARADDILTACLFGCERDAYIYRRHMEEEHGAVWDRSEVAYDAPSHMFMDNPADN